MNNEVILMVPESNEFSRKQLEKLEGGKILQTGLEGQERFGLIGDISGRHCREVRKAKVVCKWFHADEWAWGKSRVWEETISNHFRWKKWLRQTELGVSRDLEPAKAAPLTEVENSCLWL